MDHKFLKINPDLNEQEYSERSLTKGKFTFVLDTYTKKVVENSIGIFSKPHYTPNYYKMEINLTNSFIENSDPEIIGKAIKETYNKFLEFIDQDIKQQKKRT